MTGPIAEHKCNHMVTLKQGRSDMNASKLSRDGPGGTMVGAADLSGNVLGGVGVTHLTVYQDRPAPDGTYSGCAHVHSITEEAYFVVAGTGRLELHDVDNGFRAVPLQPGAFVQFSPGTVHRVVSADPDDPSRPGGLEVVVVMGNAGLAERGDARIYFGAEADLDPDLYARLAGLPKEHGRSGALDRRDASCEAYMNLLVLHENDEAAYRDELARFVDRHYTAMVAKRGEFETIVRAGPLAAAETALARVATLPNAAAGPGAATMPAEPDKMPLLGMCGMLRPVEGLSPVGVGPIEALR